MMLARSRRVDLCEFLEDEFVVFRGDADAIVADFREQLALALHRSGDPDAATRPGEVDRVANEIAEDVRDLFAIGV